MSTPQHVPYQAYKSKRHSRSFSNNFSTVSPCPSPPPRPSSVHDSLPVQPAPQQYSTENTQSTPSNGLQHVSPPPATPSDASPSAPVPIAALPNPTQVVSPPQETVCSSPSQTLSVLSSPSTPTSSLVAVSDAGPMASSSSSSFPTTIPTRTRRTSTFRHIPSRSTVTPVIPSPLSPGGHSRTVSLTSRHVDPSKPSRPHSHFSTLTLGQSSQVEPSQAVGSTQPQNGASQPGRRAATEVVDQRVHVGPPVPIHKTPSSSSSPSHTPAVNSPITSPSPSSTHASTSVRSLAPYRPGFQPKGVYRPITDEFLEVRQSRRDSGRIEQTRLERRLEKLINLHFGDDIDQKVTMRPKQARRMSSIWEIDLKSMGPSDLWRGVVQNQVTSGSKADIRAAEQSITPWQSDADVSQCPLCTASFHPITNRKHHCRLCGKIICSLPIKHPQRPVTCSLLFVADPKTGLIEEVSEGVDYGVRRRTFSSAGHGASRNGVNPEEKFLRGVRICRDCRPALLRKQYALDRIRLPTFSKLYDVFISLEKEIEDALPQFQELLLTLSSDARPTTEASMARKRLLDAFAQYDALAKRIRSLPTSGPGSSQDRVLAAVHTRANIFLQRHMFPLQVVTPEPSKSSSSQTTPIDSPVIDLDSKLAHALQPLLEQEALLESFVEEAKAHRKFEDARTLKSNLHEIRAEIDKLVVSAPEDSEGPTLPHSR
ncbi:FYVE zinc finger-domain-containing protein [Lactifluus volemus]|nr:FYVE zinc finger-domain-containing protein [Lactifluus volemus]